jgi:hypothetical protein
MEPRGLERHRFLKLKLDRIVELTWVTGRPDTRERICVLPPNA